jgi:hypothetical protein
MRAHCTVEPAPRFRLRAPGRGEQQRLLPRRGQPDLRADPASPAISSCRPVLDPARRCWIRHRMPCSRRASSRRWGRAGAVVDGVPTMTTTTGASRPS